MQTVLKRSAPLLHNALVIVLVALSVTQCGSDDPATPAPPAIGFSTTSVVFGAERGGADPRTFTVNVTSTGTTDLDALETRVIYPSDQVGGWLQVSAGTSTPTVLEITAVTGDLAAGTYSAIIEVTAGGAAKAAQGIAVAFHVMAAGSSPSVSLPTESIVFIGSEGEANPLAQTMPVNNGGEGELTGLATAVSYADGQPMGWLTASLIGSTAPTVLTLAADIAGLEAGNYDATVAVTSPMAGNSPQLLAVTLRMTTGTQPKIGFSTDSVTVSAGVGGTDPLPESVRVINDGGGNLNGLAADVTYGEGEPKDWLTASLTAATAPTDLLLQATTGALPAGTYTAAVAVSSDAATNSPQTVDVVFNVVPGDPQAIVLATGAISIIGSVGEPSSPQTLGVTNGAGGSLTGLTADVLYAPGQPSGWLSAALAGMTAPTTLRVQAAFDGLEPGVYNATVVVRSPVAGNSPQELGVTLRLTSAGS